MKKIKLIDEFKAFALKGNMVDLAIGILVGAAFNKVINSLVNDILMPPLGLLIGGVDFSDLSVAMQLPGSTKEPVLWNIGAFLSTLLDFFIIAWVIFAIVKLMNQLRGTKPEKEAENKECTECLMSIPKKATRCSHCTSSQKK